MSNTEALKLAKWVENLTMEYGISVLGVISAYEYAYKKYADKEQAKIYVEQHYIPERLGYIVT